MFITTETQEKMLNPIEEEAVEKIIEKYNNEGHISYIDLIILISVAAIGIGSLTISLLGYFRTLKTTTRNIISYITPADIHQTNRVEIILNKLLAIANADRVGIAMFHNGASVGSEHLPFKEFTLTYEAKNPSIASLKSVVRKIPLSRLTKQLDKISSTEFTECSLDNVTDNECKMYMRSVKLERIYSRLLSNKKGIYGIIEIHFINEKNTELNSEKLEEIEDVYSELLFCLKYITENKKIPKL